MTDCPLSKIEFPTCCRRRVEANFAGDRLLVGYLRPSNVDGARHAWAVLALLVKRLRREWPEVRIVPRADSGFCRHRMLGWCERHGVGYIVGLAKNPRLNGAAAGTMADAEAAYERNGEKQRLFADRASCHAWWPNQFRLIPARQAPVSQTARPVVLPARAKSAGRTPIRATSPPPT